MRKFLIPCLAFLLISLIFFSDFRIQKDNKFFEAQFNTKKLAKLQMPFIENKGQVEKNIAYYAPVFGGIVFINNTSEINYFFSSNLDEKKHVSIKENFVNGNVNVIKGLKKMSATVNHYIGSDRNKWHNDISTYTGVTLGEIYDGIAVNLKSYGNNVEKLFVVQPGADPNRIKIQVAGGAFLQINNDKELQAETSNGSITFTSPIAYQEIGGEKQSVEVAYELIDERGENNVYGFSVGDYDNEKVLVIDPLISSTFLGGSATDGMNYTNTQIAVDGEGNVYVAGCTQSVDFPSSNGAYAEFFSSGTDGFVAKSNGDLTELKCVTFFGGNEFDEITSIKLNADGSLYVAGNTESTDLPTTEGAIQRSYQGGAFNYYGSGDAFVARFDNELMSLFASTYLGGTRAEYCASVVVDKNGNVFIAGATTSDDFPVTAGAFNENYTGGGNLGEDVYVSKLSGDLTTLLASTFIGGNADELAEELAVDETGNIYFAGWVASSNYPTTENAYDRTFGSGLYDAFASKFDNNLATLKSSTYLGGNDWDFGYGITLDHECNVYVTGHTASTNFPTSENAFDRDYNGNGGRDVGDDVFVSKFDSTLGTLKASTYLGSEAWEIGYSMTTDSNGTLYITGTTSSAGFPTVLNAYDSTFGGGPKYGGDVFISRFDQNLSSLSGSTFLGGSESEGVGGIFLSRNGSVYVAGSTASIAFPTTYVAYDKKFNGGDGDIFIAKLDSLLSIDPVTTGFNAEPKTGHAPLTVQFTDVSASISPITTWQWDFNNDGAVDSNEKNPVWTYQDVGQYSVKLKVSDGSNSDILEVENYIHVFDGESALGFNGDNSCAKCLANENLNLQESMTIEAKIKPAGWGEMAVIGFGRIVDKKNLQFYVIGDHPGFNDNSVVLQLVHADGTVSVSTSETNSIILNIWQHVAVTYDANLNRVKMFVNGAEQSLFQTREPSGLIKDNIADDLFIGSNAGTKFTFDGAIDELRIWNTVRSKDQVQQNINQYLVGDESGLVAYWKMNEGNGGKIADNSSNNNDAEISEAAWVQGPELNLPTHTPELSAGGKIATDYVLYNSYPNPFNPETTIRFELPSASDVSIKIYNIVGARVRSLINSRKESGGHTIVWDGKDDAGRDVSSGVYIYIMTANQFNSTKKMLLVR